MSFLEDAERIREEADIQTRHRHGATLDLLMDIRAALDTAIDAIQENTRLRMDRDYWREQYNKMTTEGIRHGEAMMGNMLKLVLSCDIKPKEPTPPAES